MAVTAVITDEIGIFFVLYSTVQCFIYIDRLPCHFTSPSMRYTVFLGAPPPSTTSTPNDNEVSFQWHTVASIADPVSKGTSVEHPPVYLSSAPDAASRRISAVYENIIFGNEDESEGDTQIVEENLMHDMRGGETQLFPPMIQRIGSSTDDMRPSQIKRL